LGGAAKAEIVLAKLAETESLSGKYTAVFATEFEIMVAG
jgi:hypothetical protein